MPTAGKNPDAFDVLELPARFDLHASEVEAAYLARAAAAHPDVQALDPSDHDDAHAAMLNAARDTLLHLESRADVLLMRLGGPGRQEERSLPPGFLVEIMEVREQLDAALAARDVPQVLRWRAWAMDERARYARAAGELFARCDQAPARRELRVLLNAWRYIERLIEQLEPLPDSSP